MRSCSPWFVLALAACGSDPATFVDAAPAVDAPRGDGAPSTAEGFVAATLTSTTMGTGNSFEAYLHAWTPGTADPVAVFNAYYDRMGSGAALAIGACTPIVQPPFTRFASLVAGGAVALTGGPAPLALEGPSNEGYYYGSDDAAGTGYSGRPLAVSVGAGGEAVGGPGTIALGALPTITITTEPQACHRSVDCALGATIGSADLVYVTVALDTVCRLDPAVAPAVPRAAFSTRPDGPGSVRLIGLRRSSAELGGGRYQVFVATERAVSISLAP